MPASGSGEVCTTIGPISWHFPALCPPRGLQARMGLGHPGTLRRWKNLEPTGQSQDPESAGVPALPEPSGPARMIKGPATREMSRASTCTQPVPAIPGRGWVTLQVRGQGPRHSDVVVVTDLPTLTSINAGSQADGHALGTLVSLLVRECGSLEPAHRRTATSRRSTLSAAVV
jgi:hypothetical protein